MPQVDRQAGTAAGIELAGLGEGVVESQQSRQIDQPAEHGGADYEPTRTGFGPEVELAGYRGEKRKHGDADKGEPGRVQQVPAGGRNRPA